jgi:hypothetical protein
MICSSLRAARGGDAEIRDGGVVSHTMTVAYDPFVPSGHLPGFAREEHDLPRDTRALPVT